jgi:hypothetical protein
MVLANDPRLIMTEWISDFYRRRIGRFFAHPGDDHSEKEGEAGGDEGDNRCLDLEQGQIAKDEDVPDGWRVEVAHVGCGSETSRKIHFYVAFKVKDDGDDRNQLVNTGHCFPVLPQYKIRRRTREIK